MSLFCLDIAKKKQGWHGQLSNLYTALHHVY